MLRIDDVKLPFRDTERIYTIKCRLLNLLIMECCRYLAFHLNTYIERLIAVFAYFMAIHLFLQLLRFRDNSRNAIENLSRLLL